MQRRDLLDESNWSILTCSFSCLTWRKLRAKGHFYLSEWLELQWFSTLPEHSHPLGALLKYKDAWGPSQISGDTSLMTSQG